jgi:hypothetical protein
MKMLLGSGDLAWLAPVTRRLVASGIPIALWKPSGVSPCLEVWIQRDSDFVLARRVLAGADFPRAARRAPANEAGSDSAQRRSGSGRGASKMLLASTDILALEPAAKELVASGIPIAVCKASDLSSYLEVWIQRACGNSAGPILLMTGAVRRTATEVPVNPPCSGSGQRSSAGRKGVSAVTSRIGRCVWWLRQLRQT